MIFQHTLSLVLDGSKTQTRRVIREYETARRGRYNKIMSVSSNNRVKWQVGGSYAVQPGRGQSQVARIRIVGINSEYVQYVSTADAQAEGFADRQAFLQTWRHIHGDQSERLRVWVIKFELIAIEAPIIYNLSQIVSDHRVSYAHQ